MTYVQIWKEKITLGEATHQEAFNWLVGYGMNPIKAWVALNG
tara:strand:- start:2385 stop:2510 length:126 start_codon:yes stop_codon:yes gene_type:complete